MINKKTTKNSPIMAFIWALMTLLCLAGVTLASEYIDIEDIKPGSDAYCLTVLEGTNIEKFDLKVIDVIKNREPGRDIILVIGTGDRFKHIGPAKGCSGSPVYIDGKLAGALSGGWSFSKDPLYIVTPIKEMLRIDEAAKTDVSQAAAYNFDLSGPIDLAEVSEVYKKTVTESLEMQELPLVTSLPEHVCDQLSPLFGNSSLVPVSASVSSGNLANVKIEPGSVLAAPLITGDIAMAAVGTTTEVNGNQVFAFGHAFQGLGFGAVDLPMAAGNVHTVISNMIISVKLASAGPILGAIRANEATGIYGEIGAEPYMIPLDISVDRGGAKYPGMKKTYNCMMASDRFFTPLSIQYSILGACAMQGPLSQEHVIEYKANIRMKDGNVISFENVSSGQGLGEVIVDAVSPVVLLLNNPYKKTELASVEFDIKILPVNTLAVISSMELSDTKVKPGQTVTASVILRSYRSEKTMHNFEFQIPKDIEPKNYSITVAGGYAFEKFLKMSAPYKFMVTDIDSLVSSLQNVLDIKRGSLYLTIPLTSSGIVIKNQPLPYLPKTKAMMLNDKKRTVPIREQKHWLQKEKELDHIVLGSKTINITVEK